MLSSNKKEEHEMRQAAFLEENNMLRAHIAFRTNDISSIVNGKDGKRRRKRKSFRKWEIYSHNQLWYAFLFGSYCFMFAFNTFFAHLFALLHIENRIANNREMKAIIKNITWKSGEARRSALTIRTTIWILNETTFTFIARKAVQIMTNSGDWFFRIWKVSE